MTRRLPNDDEVKSAMLAEIARARDVGRRATVSAVERTFGIPHATFSRNYRDLIDWFRTSVHQPREKQEAVSPGAETTARTLQRLRRENRELRLIVDVYAAEIQRLTVDNAKLLSALPDLSNVRDIHSKTR